MSGGTSSVQAIEEKAKKKGMTVLFPQPNELFIDIDNIDDWNLFCERVEVLKKEKFVIGFSWTTSKGGFPKKHIIVKLSRNVQSEPERICLQSFLGSDRKREMLNYIAWLRDPEFIATCFFELPPKTTSTFDIYSGNDY